MQPVRVNLNRNEQSLTAHPQLGPTTGPSLTWAAIHSLVRFGRPKFPSPAAALLPRQRGTGERDARTPRQHHGPARQSRAIRASLEQFSSRIRYRNQRPPSGHRSPMQQVQLPRQRRKAPFSAHCTTAAPTLRATTRPPLLSPPPVIFNSIFPSYPLCESTSRRALLRPPRARLKASTSV